MEKENSIPKVIHLCWFSGDEYPEMVNKCIESWKRVLPDFKIKVWNAEMALKTNIPFVKEALKVRKWTFASDAVRLYALYTDGGVYMDSDILVKRRFDSFLANGVTFFQEYYPDLVKSNLKGQLSKDGNNLEPGKNVVGAGIQAAFMISEKGHPLIGKLLDYYKNRHFIKDDNTLDTSLIAPDIYAMTLENYGYRYIDEDQLLDNNVRIFPSKYVASALSYDSDDAFAIHCVMHSWDEAVYLRKIKTFIKNNFSFLYKIFSK